jgi:hypothetical protein
MAQEKSYLVTTRTGRVYSLTGKSYEIDDEKGLLIIYSDEQQEDIVFSIKLSLWEGIEII